MADNKIRFIAGGQRYDIALEDFTAQDAGDFRRTTGIRLADAVQADHVDLDVIAGLVWLVRRGTDRRLSYHAVAETLNYGNVEPVEDEGDGEPEEDLEDPQP